MRRARSVVHAVLAGWLLLAAGILAAPAAQAQDLSTPPASPVEQLATAAATAHVLIFTETAAFRHTEAIEQGTPKIQAALAGRRGSPPRSPRTPRSSTTPTSRATTRS